MGDLAPIGGEAEGSRPSITFRGVEIELLVDPDDPTIEVIEAYEEGKATAVLREVIGHRTYAKLKRSGRLRTAEDLEELGSLIAKALGFSSLGE